MLLPHALNSWFYVWTKFSLGRARQFYLVYFWFLFPFFTCLVGYVFLPSKRSLSSFFVIWSFGEMSVAYREYHSPSHSMTFLCAWRIWTMEHVPNKCPLRPLVARDDLMCVINGCINYSQSGMNRLDTPYMSLKIKCWPVCNATIGY